MTYLNILKQIHVLDGHKEIAAKQRIAYNNTKINLKQGTLMIELDWKQKIIIGLSFYSIIKKNFKNDDYLNKV